MIDNNDNSEIGNGISRREWYATFAPEPSLMNDVLPILERERLANPHNDSYKPRRKQLA